MKNTLLLLLILFFYSHFCAEAKSVFNQNEYRNCKVVGVNREPGRATFWYYKSFAEAVNGGYYNCPENISLNGKWKFYYSDSPNSLPDNFWEEKGNSILWPRIDVPGSWPMQGFDTPVYLNHSYEFYRENGDSLTVPTRNNPTAIYMREFDIPKKWKDQRVILHFGAVKSAYYVWVNGKEVGYSQDSKMAAEFDITSYIKMNEPNRVTVKVHRYSAGSYLEGQDMWRLAGIKRDVWLYATPKHFIRDFFAKTTLEGNGYGKLDLTVSLEAMKETKNQKNTLGISLLDAEGKTVFETKQSVNIGKDTEIVSLNAPIPDCRAWSAEIPYLYTLVISLESNSVQYVSSKVGFRSVVLKNGQMLVNGAPILIKGVNRHEHHPEFGHYIPKETVEKDLILMKQLNINAIRTSHYPADPYMYELADKLGFYVVDEANVEAHGQGAALQAYCDLRKHTASSLEWQAMHHDRMVRMFERDKNHACVLVWSLGNECGDGVNFTSGYDLFKGLDNSRLVQFEQAGTRRHTDIYAPMYMKMDAMRNYALSPHSYRPLILCEYAHAMGNSLGNFQDYWNLIEAEYLLQGGFIWDWVDQGLACTKDGIRYFDYGGAFGQQTRKNDGAFCLNGIVDPDRKLHPHAYEMKKVYQNYSVRKVAGEANEYIIANKHFFADSRNTQIRYQLLKNGEVVNEGVVDTVIAPNSHIVAHIATELSDSDAEYFMNFLFLNKEQTVAVDCGYPVAFEQLSLTSLERGVKAELTVTGKKMRVLEDQTKVEFWGEDFKWSFDKSRGFFNRLTVNNKNVIEGDVIPDLFRVPVDNDEWDPDRMIWFDAHRKYIVKDVRVAYDKRKDDFATVRVEGEFHLRENDPHFVIEYNSVYKINGNGDMSVTNEFLPNYYHAEQRFSIPRIGQQFALNKEFTRTEWYGRGFHENYSDRKTSAPVGIYRAEVASLEHDYIRPQENGNRSDVRWVSFENLGDGIALRFTAAPVLSFSASNSLHSDYFTEDMKPIRNTVDLKRHPKLFVNIDLGQRGIAGDNTWGNPVHMDYDLLVRAYTYNYKLEIRKIQ